MKVFNKGARTFQWHGVAIQPNQFTDLTPIKDRLGDKFEAAVKKLVADYPNELIHGSEYTADAKASAVREEQLKKENATLKQQVDKLQKLLTATDDEKDRDLVGLRARAEKAEGDLAEALKRIAELEAAPAPVADKPSRKR